MELTSCNDSMARAFAIGIDIGGTKIAVASVNAQGQLMARDYVATEAEQGFGRAIDRIVESIQKVVAQAGCQNDDLQGIGIGCAGPVDPERGTIHNPYTLPTWDNCNIVAALNERFGVPVFLENDADAALLGECFAGAGQGYDPVVMLTFGTGIGGAAIAGGRIYRGVGGGHPEIGHVPVEADGPECYCGWKGCFEAIASGTAIRNAGREVDIPDSRAVFARALIGHPGAKAIVERALQATGTATWIISHTFMPQRIILGGGLMDEHYELFAAVVRQQIPKAMMVPAGKTDVARAALANDAGLVGGANMVFSRTSAEAKE
jgi:glucokinase